jgi:hypothetical protein
VPDQAPRQRVARLFGDTYEMAITRDDCVNKVWMQRPCVAMATVAGLLVNVRMKYDFWYKRALLDMHRGTALE